MGGTHRYRGALSFTSPHHLQAGLDDFEGAWITSDRRPLFGALTFRREKTTLHLTHDGDAPAADFDPMWAALLKLASWAEHGSIEQRFDRASPEGPVRASFNPGRALPPRHLRWDLLFAARRGDAKAMRVLLDEGADPDAHCESSDTCALHEASRSGELDAVVALLDASVRLDATSRSNENAADLAKTPAIAARLRSAGLRRNDVAAALVDAAYAGNFDAVMDIVLHDAPLPEHFRVGNALTFAARAGRTREALAIVAAAASADGLRASAVTAACDAESRGHVETARALRLRFPVTERELSDALARGRDIRLPDPPAPLLDRADPLLLSLAWRAPWMELGGLLRRMHGEDAARFERETAPRVASELASWHPLDRLFVASDRHPIEPVEAHAGLGCCVEVQGALSKIDWGAIDAAPQCAASSIVRLATTGASFDAMLRSKRLQQTEVLISHDAAVSKALSKVLSKVLALPSLREVHVPGVPLTASLLRQLAKHASLQGLDLSQPEGASEAGLAALARLHALRWLKLDGVPLHEVEFLGDLPALQHCSLAQSGITDASVDALARCKRLASLSLMHTKLTAKGVATLAALPLESLSADGLPTDDLAIFGEMSSLRRLSIATSPAVDFRPLGALSRLRALDLSGTAVSGEGLDALKDLEGLEVLRLGGCRAIDDRALARIARFEALRVLDLRHTSITGAGLAALASLGSLEMLAVSLADFVSEEVSMLASLPRLRVVASSLPRTSPVRAALPRLSWL